jgi:hypothetical protein
MASAEQLFTEVWSRLQAQCNMVTTFRRLGALGLPNAKNVERAENERFVQRLVNSSDFDRFFTDKKAFLEAGLPDALPERLTVTAVTTFESALDAASLVFAHSIIDGAAFELCRICSVIAPADFDRFVDQRKVTLAQLRDASVEALRAQLIEAYLDTLERESLLTKADLLFQICQPPSSFDPIRDYSYSRDLLVQLDELRHKVVHSSQQSKPLPNGPDDLWFLQRTGYLFMTLLNEKYGVRVNPAHMKDIWKPA